MIRWRAVCALALAVALLGCGSSSGTRSSERDQVAAGIARLRARHAYTVRASYRFALNDRGLPASLRAALARLFPAQLIEAERVRQGSRTITVDAPHRVTYTIDGPSITIGQRGRLERPTAAEVRAIRRQLAARTDYLVRLPDAAAWQRRRGAPGAPSVLRAVTANANLAADLLPGLSLHPAALSDVKLTVDVQLDRTGTLRAYSAALSTIVDLSATAPRPSRSPLRIGLGLAASVVEMPVR